MSEDLRALVVVTRVNSNGAGSTSRGDRYRGRLVFAGASFFSVQVADFDVRDFSRKFWQYEEVAQDA